MHYCEACERSAWHLKIWKRDDPATIRLIPYRCRSWRHEGDCRVWKGAQDFVRCREAIEKNTHWSHVCLTFEQSCKKLDDEVFRDCVFRWSKLRKRICRQYGNFKYIQTWEVHRSGWPHVHIALSNAKIHGGFCENAQQTFNFLLRKHATECGFGKQGWCDPLRDEGALAGYLVKLCRELTGRGKAYQIPINAPKNFRRLRSSVRLLPPCLSDPELTGCLVMSPMPELVLPPLVNTGISGRTEKVYSIENRETYREKLTADGWVTEGLD